MLKVWGRKTSSNVQAVMWCIGELNLEYQRFDIGHKYGGNDTPEFLSMNPNGTVPVLKDDEQAPLWESGAILRYLASAYASAPFWPQNPAARAPVDMWAEWSKLNFAHNFGLPIFWRVARTAPSQRDPKAIAEAIHKLTAILKIAEYQFSRHEYLAGEHFTLADIQFGHILYRYFTLEIERPDLPRLAAYYQRLTQRPAYQEHVMVSYDELRVTE